jgi:hypothetical protein
MQITKASALTGVEHTREIDVEPEKYAYFISGGLYAGFVQDEFPHLSADDREFLLTGITPEEWVAAFGQEDYDQDGEGEVWSNDTLGAAAHEAGKSAGWSHANFADAYGGAIVPEEKDVPVPDEWVGVPTFYVAGFLEGAQSFVDGQSEGEADCV